MNTNATITSYLRGYMGNQLFIYAAARQIQEKQMGGAAACKLVIDAERSAPVNCLSNLRLIDGVSFERTPWPAKQKIVRHFLYSRHFDQEHHYQQPEAIVGVTLRNRKALQRAGLILTEDCYLPVEERLPPKVFLDGYFQSERFFPDIRDLLLQELQPKEPPLPKNQEMLSLLRSTESVCLTVRMNFLHGIDGQMYRVCTLQYFRRAIEMMKWLHPNCRFFLFADDVEAAKAQLPLPEDTVCEQGNDPDYEKLRVMANSKHFIISNSSFSWWVQYLGTAPNKTVIAPNHWYTTPIPCEIYQKNWILLPTD